MLLAAAPAAGARGALRVLSTTTTTGTALARLPRLAVSRSPYHQLTREMAAAGGGIHDAETVQRVLAETAKGMAQAYERSQARYPEEEGRTAPTLIAVSKLHSMDSILSAYEYGQREFGENYVAELCDKAASKQTPEDVRWHFIGALQRNKVKAVLSVKNLAAIHTIHTTKLADACNKHAEGRAKPLSIMVQVNTSREENKSGCLPEECVETVKHVRTHCPNLKLIGLMTIGQFGRVLAEAEDNPDFVELRACRATVCSALDIPTAELGLSMGMSADYEHAVELGSTHVRVGSSIFGTRPPKKA